jgi:hypothetical protein
MAMGYLALLLQAMLFIHLFMVVRWGISLWGNAWELGLLAIAAIASTIFLIRPPQAPVRRWQRGLYGLNLFCLIPLLLTAALMALLMYGTHPMGTFQSGQGGDRHPQGTCGFTGLLYSSLSGNGADGTAD